MRNEKHVVPGDVPLIGSFPTSKMDSPNSARFHLASSGETSRQQSLVGKLPVSGAPRVPQGAVQDARR